MICTKYSQRKVSCNRSLTYLAFMLETRSLLKRIRGGRLAWVSSREHLFCRPAWLCWLILFSLFWPCKACIFTKDPPKCTGCLSWSEVNYTLNLVQSKRNNSSLISWEMIWAICLRINWLNKKDQMRSIWNYCTNTMTKTCQIYPKVDYWLDRWGFFRSGPSRFLANENMSLLTVMIWIQECALRLIMIRSMKIKTP